MTVRVRFTPALKTLRGRLTGLRSQLVARAEQGIVAIGERAAKRMRDGTPRDTGELADGWQAKRIDTPTGLVVTIFNSAPKAYEQLRLQDGRSTNLAEIIEYGSRPHRIVPKRAKALRFVADGAVVFAQEVFHPGTRPYAPVRIATVRAAEEMRVLLRKLDKIARDSWKG